MIRWLHISDLHIKTKDADWNCMKNAILESTKELDIDFVIVTGDFHNFCDKGNYEPAKDFLRRLMKELALDIDEDLFIVPGNHDAVNGNLVAGREKLLREALDKPLQIPESAVAELSKAFTDYDSMAKELIGFYRRGKTVPSSVHVRVWRDQINIIHLNTALISDNNKEHGQLVDLVGLTEDGLRDQLAEGLPVFVMGHHSFFDLGEWKTGDSASQESRVRNILVQMFNQSHVSAYLCGDKHIPNMKEDRTINLKNAEITDVVPNIIGFKGAACSDDDFSKFGMILYECREDGKVSLNYLEWEEDGNGQLSPKDKDTNDNRTFFSIKNSAWHVGKNLLYEDLKKSLDRERQKNPSWTLCFVPELKPEGIMDLNMVTVETGTDPIPLKTALERSWQEKQNHFMMEGVGGLGKTVALLSLSDEISKPVIYIPLCSLEIFKNNKGEPFIETYIKSVTLQENENTWHIFDELSREEWQGGPGILLLLDGMNEIPEELRPAVLREIEQWSMRQGIQIVMASRYDFRQNLNIQNCYGLKLQPLKRDKIAGVLSEFEVAVPEQASKLWNVLDTPLMLGLYAQTEKNAEKEDSGTALWRENTNAGAIIWNYLQSEIVRYQRQKNEKLALCGALADFIAPYIAYQMARQGKFSLNAREFQRYMKEACNLYNQCAGEYDLPEHIADLMIEAGKEGNSTIAVGEIIDPLTKEMNLFRKIGKSYRLMHQHFRDCLAAIHILNTAEIRADRSGSDDMLPAEWRLPFDRYVMGFLADLLRTENRSFQEGSWNRIWETARKGKDISDDFALKMLKLYRLAYGSDISQVDFGETDLSRVPLLGYRLTEKSRGHFQGTHLGEGNFRENGHMMSVISVSWNGGSEHFLSASHDCTMRMWDIESKSYTVLPEFHTHYIRCAQCSPVAKDRLASAGDDKEVVCWEYDRKQQRWTHRVLGKSQDWVYGAAWDCQGEKLICGDREGNVKLFDLIHGEKTYEREHKGFVRTLAWSPTEENLFVTGSDEGSVCLWREEQDTALKKLIVGKKKIKKAAWVDAGRYLLIADSEKIVFMEKERLLNTEGREIFLEKRQDLAEKCLSRSQISCIAVRAREGKDYVAVYTHRSVELFYVSWEHHGPDIHSIESARLENEGVVSADWNQECDMLICGCGDGGIYRISVTDTEIEGDRIGIQEVARGSGRSARCAAWSHDGRRLAAGYDDWRIRIWDVENRRCTGVMEGHKESVKCLCWSPDDNMIVSGADDGEIRIWNTEDQRCMDIRNYHSEAVNSILWLKTGKIFSGSDDTTLRIWDTKENLVSEPLKKHEKRVYSITLSPDEAYLASAGNDRHICLWDAETGENVQDEISFHEEPIRGISWFPDGSAIATGSNDKRIIFRKYDTEKNRITKGREILPEEHADFIYSVSCAGNNRYVASGSTDFTVGFWDMWSNALVGKGTEHENFVWSVSSGPEVDGRYFIASTSSDGTVKIWDVTEIIPAKDGTGRIIPVVLSAAANLEVLADINLVGCDFYGAVFESEELKEKVRMNGGVVEEKQ